MKKRIKGKTRVIFSVRDSKISSAGIESHGGKILKKLRNLVAAEVPADQVGNIVNTISAIKYARSPQKFFPQAVMSEGVNVTGANTLHDIGITGRGVKIAVIDIGFMGLSAAQSNGDMPSSVITRDFTGSGMQAYTPHGTACAELAYDMAPGAELYLVKIFDEIDFYNAIDYCISVGIDIISISIGVMGTGPGNGTGPVDEACDDARANGILIAAAAGNGGNMRDADGTEIGTHWQGAFLDSGSDYSFGGTNDVHQFISGDSESVYNVILAIPVLDDAGNPATDEVTIMMRWDDWPNANVDYDMFLFDYFTGALVDYSNTVQNGSQPPLEFIVVDVPDSVEFAAYTLRVTKKSGEPAGKELELFLGGMCVFTPFEKYSSPIASSASSIFEPADAVSVVAAGAIGYANYTTGPQEDFSSQGPTNAWSGAGARIKPDICGPDGVSGYTYGPSAFYGTSAPAPHTAGAAALILSMHPHFTADDLQGAIESSAIDMGSSGKDNIYGWGRLRVDTSLNSPPVLEWAGGAGYLNDGLNPETGSSSTSFTYKIKYIDPDGDAPSVRELYIDKNGDGDYSDTGEAVEMAPTGSDYASGVIYTYSTAIPYSPGSNNCSYYFKFSDNAGLAAGNITGAISPQTAINKPDIFQSLSLIIDHTNWQLASIPAGSEHITNNLNKIIVTNNGDGLETYSLQISNSGGWSASPDMDGAGVNTFVLSGLFTESLTAIPDSTYFNEIGNDDVITAGAPARASATRFGSARASQGGSLVPAGGSRNLWLEFKAPANDTTLAPQPIEITITAELP